MRIRRVLLAAVLAASVLPAAKGFAAETGSMRPAAEPGFDLGGIVESVSHYVHADESGRLVSDDAGYRLVADDAGFALALRSRAGDSFEDFESIRIATVSIGVPGVSVDPGPWRARANVAERLLTRGMNERLTARDGEVEWDVILERPPGGPVVVSAAVAGAVSDPQRRDGVLRFALPNGRAILVGDVVVVDASGRTLHRSSPRTRGGTIALDVPASALHGARYPVTIDPAISPEYGATDPVYLNASGEQRDVAGAGNGSTWLVVWIDERLSEGDVWAARFDSSGAVLDPGGLMLSGGIGSGLSGEGNASAPTVASNGTDFLVAWAHDTGATFPPLYKNLHATTVGNDGLIGGEHEIASVDANQDLPAAAWNGSNYLVAWQDNRNGTQDVYARRLTAAGVNLGSSDIAVSTATGDQQNPAVASNGLSFLVAWDDTRTSTARDVYAARVDGSGAVLDPAGIVVSAASDVQQAVDLAWNGSTYLAVWSDRRSGSTYDVYGARVDTAGAVLDASGIAISTAANAQTTPSVASDGVGFLVAWTDTRSGTAIYAARVAGSGSVQDPSGIAVSTGSGARRAPDVVARSGEYLVAWEDERSDTGDVYGSRLASSGTVIDAGGLLLSKQANSTANPGVAFDGANYLLVWDDGRPSSTGRDIWATRVTPAGVVLDPAGFAVSTATATQSAPKVASDGSQFLVVWEDGRAGGALRKPYATRVSAAGLVLDPAGIALAAPSTSNSIRPDVAWGGTSFLVVWLDLYSPDQIEATRVAPDGTRLDPSGIPLALVIGTPRVASDGSGWMVVWEDEIADVARGTRIDSAGTVLDPSWITFATAAQLPAVAGGPSGYLVAWTTDAGHDSVATRVADDGTILDPAGIVLGDGKHLGRIAVAFNGIDYVAAWERTVFRSAEWTTDDDIVGARVTESGAVRDSTPFTFAGAVSDDETDPTLVAGDGGRVAVAFHRADRRGPYGSLRSFVRFVDDSPNDLLADALSLAGSSGSRSPGTRAAGKEVGEPNHAGNGGGGSVWFSWTPPAGQGGAATFDTIGSGFDTLLAAYTGTSVSSLTPVAASDDVVGTASRIVFTAVRNTTYRIALDGKNGARGGAKIAWSFAPDTTPPETTITSAPPATTNATAASFSFAASELSTFECALDAAPFSACASPQTYSALIPGAHSFAVRATDVVAGNVDPSPASWSWTIDTTPPETTLESSPPDVSGSSVSFSFSSNEPGTFACALDGGTFAGCPSPKTYTNLPDGTHTFRVRAIDSATNQDPTPAERAWAVDTGPPNTTVTTGPPAYTAATSVSLAFTATEPSTFECSLDAAPFTPCTSPQSYAGLAEGSYTFEVRATDVLGNTDPTPAARSFTVDRTPPDTTITQRPPAYSASTVATLAFTSTQGSLFHCSLDNGAFIGCVSPKTYAGLTDGSHTVRVRGVDFAGNVDPTPDSATWTIDTSAPDLTFLQPVPGGLYVRDMRVGTAGGQTLVVGAITVRLRATDAGSPVTSVAFDVNGTPVPPASVAYDTATQTYSFTYTPTSVGNRTITARGTNQAGLVRTVSASFLGVPG